MKFLSVILLVAINLSIASCSSSTPSESEAKDELIRMYSSAESPDLFTITNFKKIDGTEKVVDGVKQYDMQVSYTMTYPKGMDCDYKLKYGVKKRTPTTPKETCFNLGINPNKGAILNPGDSLTGEETLHYKKTESGWKLIYPHFFEQGALSRFD